MADFSWLEDDMFIDTVFPLALSVGASVTFEFQTLITRVDNAQEARNPRWDGALRFFTLRTARSLTDLQTLRDFYEVMRGRANSFKFQDPTEFTSSSFSGENLTPDATTNLDQNIGTGDASEVAFQLRKQRIVGINVRNRLISKPVTGTVKIALDGVDQDPAASPVPWTVDTATGIVTFATPPGGGVAITAGFDFYVPVRFDSDVLAATIVSTLELEVTSVVLRELRGA